jgi:threonine aldolase
MVSLLSSTLTMMVRIAEYADTIFEVSHAQPTMSQIRIDLFSDTITRPTPAMRRFMAEAEVGDEQKHEDPTTNRLQEMVCELLGKEDAVFLPSGTLCNAIAVRVHCRPGDEVILDRTAHPIHFEVGGPAALNGVMLSPLQGIRGIFTASQLEEAIRPESNHAPRSRLVSVEQSTNLGGGAVWSLETIREVCTTARHHGLATHMDGARLLNAAVASGVPAKAYAAEFDSVWIDMSKGLGCPVGAVLAGSRNLIREAWRYKHQLGGAMRQSGIIAAAGVYALQHHVERLAEDHDNARLLAQGLAAIAGLSAEPVETNIVFFNVSEIGLSATELAKRTLTHGVRLNPVSKTRIRAVTHLDVSRADIEEAVRVIEQVIKDEK